MEFGFKDLANELRRKAEREEYEEKLKKGEMELRGMKDLPDPRCEDFKKKHKKNIKE